LGTGVVLHMVFLMSGWITAWGTRGTAGTSIYITHGSGNCRGCRRCRWDQQTHTDCIWHGEHTAGNNSASHNGQPYHR